MPAGVRYDEKSLHDLVSSLSNSGAIYLSRERALNGYSDLIGYKVRLQKTCGGCALPKYTGVEGGFSTEQWLRRDIDRRCGQCIDGASQERVCYGVLCYDICRKVTVHPLSSFSQAGRRLHYPKCIECEPLECQSQCRGVACPLKIPKRFICAECNSTSFECGVCDGKGFIDGPVTEELAVELRNSKITREELLENGGDWDLIMAAGHRFLRASDPILSSLVLESRRVKGTLKLSRDGHNDVSGIISMQQGHEFVTLAAMGGQRILLPHSKIRFQTVSDFDASEHDRVATDRDRRSRTLRRTLRIGDDGLAIKASYGGEDPPQEVTGVIRVVSNRIALPRCKDMKRLESFASGNPTSLSAEEGDALMERFRSMVDSWLCTRLGLTETQALLIRQFLCPEPVFFLKPGDLIMRRSNISATGEHQPVLLVARKKEAETS